MKHTAFALLLTLLVSVCNAQQVTPKPFTDQPLNLILKHIESAYDVAFSYDASLIENTNLSLTVKGSLLQNLKKIEEYSALRFKKIGTKSFIIQKQSNTQIVNICGYIKSQFSKLPIEYASVYTSDKSKHAITNNEGFFSIYGLQPNQELTLQILGFKTLKIVASKPNTTTCNTYFLIEDTQDLDEIIITNYLNNGFTKYKDGSIKAKLNQMSVLPGLIDNDVMQAVQIIPGVQSPDETATGLNVRGSTSDHNLILYDGIKMYHYDHFFGMLSAFNSSIIDNVVLSKSASSSKYRSHIAGVVDIKTHSDIPEKIEAGIGTNLIFADAYVRTPIGKKTAITASARRSFTDAFQTVTFDDYSDHVFQNTKISEVNSNVSTETPKNNYSYYFEDYTLKTLHKFNDDSKLTFSGIYSFNDLDFRSLFSEINQISNDKLKIKSFGATLNYQKQWTDKLKISTSLTYSNYNFDYNGNQILDAFFNYNTVKQNDINDFNFSINANYTLSKNSSIAAGYDYINDELSYTIGNTSDVEFEDDFRIEQSNSQNNTHEAFAEYSYNKNKWSVKTGLRTSYVNKLKKAFLQPNVNIRYAFNSKFSLQLLAEQKNQFISQIVEFETENFGLENQVWVLSDEKTVPVLQNKQVSLTGIYKQKDWYIDTEVFVKESSGITSLTKGFNREINNFSVGKNKVKGLEVLVKKQFNNFSTLVSYALTSNKSQFLDLNSAQRFDGNLDIRHYLSVIQNMKINRLELSAGWRFRTARAYTPALGLSGDNADNIAINYGEINSARLNDYNRFDISSTYKFTPFNNKKVKAKVSLSLLNVFNKRNDINRSYRIVLDLDDTTFKLRELNKFSITRTPNLLVRLDF